MSGLGLASHTSVQLQPTAARICGTNPIAPSNAHNNMIFEHNFIVSTTDFSPGNPASNAVPLLDDSASRCLPLSAPCEDKTSSLDKMSGQILVARRVVAGFPDVPSRLRDGSSS